MPDLSDGRSIIAFNGFPDYPSVAALTVGIVRPRSVRHRHAVRFRAYPDNCVLSASGYARIRQWCTIPPPGGRAIPTYNWRKHRGIRIDFAELGCNLACRARRCFGTGVLARCSARAGRARAVIRPGHFAKPRELRPNIASFLQRPLGRETCFSRLAAELLSANVPARAAAPKGPPTAVPEGAWSAAVTAASAALVLRGPTTPAEGQPSC